MAGTGPITFSGSTRSACQRLFEASHASRFGIGYQDFQQILAEVAARYLPEATEYELVRFWEGLRVEELALARACVAGNEKAWEEFLSRYRASLYAAAQSIAREESVARELADSLYAELFGLPRESGQRVSKLQYYSGRGSLEGWLRTVVAQEYVNRYRRAKREVSLEEKIEAGAQFAAPDSDAATRAGSMTDCSQAADDPRLDLAISKGMAALDSEGRFILSAYYLDGRTLAEIAVILHVHESTISRKLERITGALRKAIRKDLLAAGFTPRQADELMQDLDVRDLSVDVRGNLQQDARSSAFYKGHGE